jgi:hypothetical protein
MTNHGEQSGATSASGREQALADTFVMLADTLVDDYDVVDLLQRLTESCVGVLGASAAGLLLLDQRGGLAVVASSSEESRLLEVFQLQNNEGPCLECVRSGTAVVSGDLGPDVSRWPLFVPAATGAGFKSVVAVPMRLPPDDQRLAQALADVATIGILQQRITHRSVVLAEQLQQALNSRVTIEQAKGILAERGGLEMDKAFARIRRYARNHNLKLTDVALAVIRGDIDPTAP